MSEPAAFDISIIVPVYNEEKNLPLLFSRLYPALDALQRSYELIFIDDGSADRSVEMLRAQHALRPDVTRVFILNANYGQHMAIIAAFERVRGQVVITLDADLQNPPEEIHKLVAQLDAGHDYVGGFRLDRQDSLFRTMASRGVNAIRRWTTNIEMTDQGCMLRGYSRDVTDAVARSNASNTFLPALAYGYASSPTEVGVRHEARHAGASSYSVYKLIRLNFDFITGFSLVPLQIYTLFSLACAGGSLALFAVLFIRRFVFNLDRETFGVFTLFAILFFLVSVVMVGIGLIGEYIGRTYQVVRTRQRYVVKETLETTTR